MSVQSTLFAAIVSGIVGFSAVAHADPVVVQVAGRDHAAVYSDLVRAAEKACQSARKVDFFDDYGTQEECVDGSLQQATATLEQSEDSATYRIARNETQEVSDR